MAFASRAGPPVVTATESHIQSWVDSVLWLMCLLRGPDLQEQGSSRLGSLFTKTDDQDTLFPLPFHV